MNYIFSEGDIVQYKIMWIVEGGNVWIISKERGKGKESDNNKNQKGEDIIGNDDEDFVLIGWQTLINAFTKLFLPATRDYISTDTTPVLWYNWHEMFGSSHRKIKVSL